MYPRNDDTVSSLNTEFQQTYDGTFAWESIVSAYLALPGLRSFWPMTAIGPSGEARDLGGAGLNLGQANNPIVGVNPPQYRLNSNERLHASNASNFNITGAENYIASSWRGLTMGLWINFVTIEQQTLEAIMSKWNSGGGGKRQYELVIDTGNTISFLVSNTGADTFTVSTAVEPTTGKWYFLVGRFNPSTELAIFLNDTKVVNTSSIPATINSSNDEFAIGSNNGGANYLDARVSMAFLTCTYLPDSYIRKLYYRTRPLYQNRSEWDAP